MTEEEIREVLIIELTIKLQREPSLKEIEDSWIDYCQRNESCSVK